VLTFTVVLWIRPTGWHRLSRRRCASRARKRPKGAPAHVGSWPLRPDAGQCRQIGARFFTEVRVFNAVLGEFIARSRAVKSDPAWQAARDLPRRTPSERKDRGAALRAVETAHEFSVDAAQSYASSLRTSWVREHLRAEETQNLGVRAFGAVRQWHLGVKGKPRFKPAKRGLHSLAAKDVNGTVCSWEAGRDPIPERIRLEVEQIEAMTADAVGVLVDALIDERDHVVVVYRTDEALHAARPGTQHLPARWWRHVVARAVDEVPGVVVVGR
jgi:hypothetical protein